jgi:hypothetical protein
MTYLLPRAFVVLMGWGMTCALIYNVRSNVDPIAYYAAGAIWAFVGIVCFSYLYRLRREVSLDPGRSLSTGQSAT